MSQPRKITRKTFDRVIGTAHSPYVWRAWILPDRPNCVPYTILGRHDDVAYVEHGMKVDCRCPENSNATVTCYAQRENGDCYKTFHKPGQCPFLKYEKKEDK